MNLKLTETEDKLDDVAKESAQLRESLEKLQTDAAEKGSLSKGEVDSKLQAMLEKLKVNNQIEWAQTVKEAEK